MNSFKKRKSIIHEIKWKIAGNFLYFDEYFLIYIIINNKLLKYFSQTNENSKINKMGTNVELKFKKISVELLSQPFMEKCINYGKY